MNCVLDSMRKSLNTECRRLSVALVSWIRPSNCFSISCVLDNILWEKSCRKRNNCRDKKQKTFSLYNTAASAYNMKHECFPTPYPWICCQWPVCAGFLHLVQCPGSLPHLLSLPIMITGAILHKIRHAGLLCWRSQVLPEYITDRKTL